MTQRFLKDRLYHFKGEQWSQFFGKMLPYECVILGTHVRSQIDSLARSRDFKGEWKPDGRTYRVCEGHLPDYQPRVSAAKLQATMARYGAIIAHPVAA
jgi:hypothetical protein